MAYPARVIKPWSSRVAAPCWWGVDFRLCSDTVGRFLKLAKSLGDFAENSPYKSVTLERSKSFVARAKGVNEEVSTSVTKNCKKRSDNGGVT